MLRTLTLVAALASTLLVAVSAAAQPYPAEIQLPPGWQPEGIAVGKGHTFYVGSIPTGAIYAGDLRTGDGDPLVPAQEGRNAVGIEVDSRDRIFVAGGMTGDAYVYDARTGDVARRVRARARRRDDLPQRRRRDEGRRVRHGLAGRRALPTAARPERIAARR